MRVLTVVHQPNAGPGVFADAAAARGDQLVTWVPRESPAPELDGFGAALVFGGAMHVDQEAEHPWLRGEKELIAALLARRVPLLGVCLGGQLLSEVAGGRPHRAPQPEIGWHELELLPGAEGDPLLGELTKPTMGFEWHSYEMALPPRSIPLARTALCMQAFRLEDAAAWGIQFHAEVESGSIESWLTKSRGDEDRASVLLDEEAVRAETRERIGAWNELGRSLCHRFLEEAAVYSSVA